MSHFASKKKSVLCQIITEIILSKVTAEILLRKFRLGSLFLVQLQINSLQFYKNILCCGFFWMVLKALSECFLITYRLFHLDTWLTFLAEVSLKNSCKGSLFQRNSGKQPVTFMEVNCSNIFLCAFPSDLEVTVFKNHFFNIASHYSMNLTMHRFSIAVLKRWQNQ